MTDQLSFSSLDYAGKKKRTKRDVFLAEMAAVVPWSQLEAVIEPHYPKVGPQGGRRPFPLIVFRAKTRSIFVHSFAKSERANIGTKELEFWRTVATAFLGMSERLIEVAIAADEITEVMCDEENQED